MKGVIGVIIWVLVSFQLALLFDAISVDQPVNWWVIGGILLAVIVLTIIQFSIKVK